MIRAALIFAFALTPLVLGACNAPAGEAQPADGKQAAAKVEKKPVGTMTAKELHAEKDEVRLLIDVRTPAEYAEGRVPGAINIPIDQFDERLGEFGKPEDGRLHLVCRSGGRSGKVAKKLAAKGYETVNIVGGTLAWSEAGYEVEK